jgi:hypothetical protein
MKYIQFQQTNIFLRGTAVDSSSEPENEFAFKQYNYYEKDQLILDKYALSPEIDITNDVNVMGDIYNQDTQLMKAYGSFEIQIDYYELMYKAKEDLKDTIELLKKKNTVTFTQKAAWDQPSHKSYHDFKYE